MITMSRRRPAKLAPTPETEAQPLPSTPRELFDALPPLPGLRTEIIDGKLLVSPVGTPEHGWKAMLLSYAVYPLIEKRGWRAWAGNIDVCIDGPRDPVEPDFAMAPLDCPRWGESELLSTGLLMVAEIVSRGSVNEDRDKKPGIYARGGVPIMLLIDSLSSPPSVTVLSEPKDGVYQTVARVAMGATLQIPDPIDFELDTSIFLDRDYGEPTG